METKLESLYSNKVLELVEAPEKALNSFDAIGFYKKVKGENNDFKAKLMVRDFTRKRRNHL